MLMASPAYKTKDYAKALEETFVELDYLLLSSEGHEKMRAIAVELK